MSENKFDIESITTLAKLKLDETEKTRLESHLIKILKYVEQLNELDTSDLEPTFHVLPVQNVFREDLESRPFGNSEKFLNEAPKRDKRHYEVPQIIG